MIVATDDNRIAAAAAYAGAKVAMTRSDLRSGTDRVAEACRLGLVPPPSANDVVVNIQGDEPCIDAEAIRAVVAPFAQSSTKMATAAAPLGSEEAESPNVVKVVCNARGQALYFSRATIPHGAAPGQLRRHIGIYAYRLRTLLRLASLPAAPLEQSERLEQLRALYHGIPIQVIEVPRAWRGVDTPEDLRVLSALMANNKEQDENQ